VILFKYQLDKYSTDGPHNPGHCACVSPANGGSACGHNHYVSQECLHSEDKDRVPVPANSYRDVCTLNCLRDRAQKQGRQSRSGGVQAGSFNFDCLCGQRHSVTFAVGVGGPAKRSLTRCTGHCLLEPIRKSEAIPDGLEPGSPETHRST
jgi:hypothetical protein